MDELTKMPNIGTEIAAQLRAAGIESPQQLQEIGAKEVWLRIQKNDPSACYNRLCGLQGAIENIRWHHLDDGTKADLKQFYDQHKLANTSM